MADTQQTDDGPTGPDERLAWPALATLWVWVAGWLPLGAAKLGHPFHPALMLVLAAASAVFGLWWATDYYSPRMYGPDIGGQVAALLMLSSVAAGWWWWRAAESSPWRELFSLLGLAVIAGSAWFALCTRAERAARAEERTDELMATLTAEDALRLILWQSGAYDVLVHAIRQTRAGYTAVLGPDPKAQRRVTYSQLSTRISDIATNLAMYHREKERVELEDTDVRLIGVTLDRWELYVSTRHVLRETVPFDMSWVGKPFGRGILLGLLEDGAEIVLTLLGNHLKIVGMTGGGKSVILRNIIARCIGTRDAKTGAPDCLVWVAATAKLVPLVWGFVAPFLSGQQRRPVLDWVAGQDPRLVREFLVCLYAVVQDRNDRLDEDDKIVPTSDTPAIVAILEEAKVMTGSKDKVVTGDGREWQTGELINEILTLGRSAAVSLVLVTQQGLYTGGLGQWGDQMMRNLTLRLCTATMTESDGRTTLPAMPVGVDTTRLKHNSLYYQPGIGEDARAMPGKAALIDKHEVGGIALRMGDQTATLEAAAVAAIDEAAGEPGYYAGRWNIDRLAELGRAVRRRGWLWPVLGAAPVVVAPVATQAAPAAPPRAAGPVTRPDAGTDPDGWRPDWDRELDEVLTSKGHTREGSGMGHAPSTEEALSRDVDRITELAELAHRQADAWLAEHGDPTEGGVDTAGLPPRMAGCLVALRQLQAQGHAAVWVATADLSLIVNGNDELAVTTELGRQLTAEAAPSPLVSTEAKPRINGRRGRGFMVADLEAAVEAKRARTG